MNTNNITRAKFPARLARVGEQIYSDGPDWRSPEEVFAPAALAGLDGLRVQLGHVPAEGVAVGRVVPGTVVRDGDHVSAELEITDPATVAAIRSKSIREISLAYSCDHTTDASGRRCQTNIRFAGPGAHVALLDGQRQRARCGSSCSIQDHFMPIRHTDAVAFDGTDCGCNDGTDQAQRDRVDAWLDHNASQFRVSKSAIVNEMARVHDAATTEITRDLIKAAAERLARPGSYMPSDNSRAEYHRPATRHADANSSDEAFRALLASKLPSERADLDDSDDDDRPARTAPVFGGAAHDTDDGFRASLAKKQGDDL